MTEPTAQIGDGPPQGIVPSTCVNCQWSYRDAAPESVGVLDLENPPTAGPLQCRRYPPVVLVVPTIRDAQIVTVGVQVADGDWCGEHTIERMRAMDGTMLHGPIPTPAVRQPVARDV